MMDERDQHVTPTEAVTTGPTKMGRLAGCRLILLGRNRQWCCNHCRGDLFQRNQGFLNFGSSLLSSDCCFFLPRPS